MKKTLSLLLVLVMVLSLCSVTAFAAENYTGKTVILYTANVRGAVDVYAKVAAAKTAYENAGADVILADAGNFLQGTAAANSDRGLGVYNLMDAAGYDVAAMGLAEFGYADATTGYKPSVENSDYDLKVVGDPITAVPVYFILRQDDEAEALVKEIDDTLQEMIDDGTVTSLSELFLGEDVLQSIDSAAK